MGILTQMGALVRYRCSAAFLLALEVLHGEREAETCQTDLGMNSDSVGQVYHLYELGLLTYKMGRFISQSHENDLKGGYKAKYLAL